MKEKKKEMNNTKANQNQHTAQTRILPQEKSAWDTELDKEGRQGKEIL